MAKEPAAKTSKQGVWLSVWLDDETKKKLRVRAAVEETSMSKLAADLIRQTVNPSALPK